MAPELIAGRYRVLRSVGHGGMGTVWLCRDEVLGREVAVKQVGVMPGETAPDAARALREARTSAALNHRNVVSVFDIVDGDDGRVWLVMEYVPSRTLAQIIRDEGPLPPHRAAAIGAQVAAGLAAAHEAGTIHRDVKPGNVLVTEDGTAKLGDFGIARAAGEEQLTRTGLVTGTPSYFSPELARGEDPAPPADVYALGATLYAAVEGHPPYPEQRNAIVMLQQIAAAEPPAPQHAGELANPIARMMDRDPQSRWSVVDAAHALRRIAERLDPEGTATEDAGAAGAGAAAAAGTAGAAVGAAAGAGVPEGAAARGGGTSAASSAPSTAPAQRGRRSRRGLALATFAALGLLAVLGVGYMLVAGDGAPQSPPVAAPSGTADSTPSDDAASPSEPASEAAPRTSPPPETEAPTQDTEDGAEQDGAGQDGAEQDGPARDNAPSVGPVDTVESYFALMPEDTDSGWQMLAPSMRAQGRGSYEAFWADVASVELHSAESAGSNQVLIELTYRFTDGSASRERQRLTLQQQGGDYLIAEDEVLSSRSVS